MIDSGVCPALPHLLCKHALYECILSAFFVVEIFTARMCGLCLVWFKWSLLERVLCARLILKAHYLSVYCVPPVEQIAGGDRPLCRRERPPTRAKHDGANP